MVRAGSITGSVAGALAFAACLIFNAGPASADIVVLDLGKQAAPATLTIPAPSADVTFRVVNRRPDSPYTYSVVDRIQEIAAFSNEPRLSLTLTPPPTCAPLLSTAASLATAKTEAEVGRKVAAIDRELAAGACADPESVRDIQEAVSRTTFDLPGSYRVTAGHDLALTVRRSEGGKDLSWTLVIQGGSRGIWLTTYGATFVPDRDETFFTQSTAAAGRYAIVREHRTAGVKPLPAVLFTWLPRTRQDHDWAVGPTAGLGFKSDRPTPFVGASLVYNWNVAIVGGLAVVPETRLSGRYSETDPPQIVSESLSGDQLNVKVSRIRWFGGVSFRFGSNPFK